MRLRFQWITWCVLAALFLGLFLTPIFWPQWFETPLFTSGALRGCATVGLIALCPLAAWLALAGENIGRREKVGAFGLALAATAICEVIHYWVTDRGHYFSPAQFADNTVWQQFMHGPILRLEIGALPHSYRFLPDAIVKVFTWLCGDFVIARIAYRLLFMGLLFVTVYRFARTYVRNFIAGSAVMMLAAIYPLTILKYAGQFVDPLSHLSFLACLCCLARGYEPGFGPSLVIGLFAKESVIVMAICRAFYGSNRVRSAVAAAVYLAVAAAVAVGIRLGVNRGNMSYGQISGVGMAHVLDNLAGWREWILIYVAGFGSLLPGAILAWKHTDVAFRLSAFVVIPAVLVSSLLFSWMSEVRNMMPAFALLAVANTIGLWHAVNALPPGATAPPGSSPPR